MITPNTKPPVNMEYTYADLVQFLEKALDPLTHGESRRHYLKGHYTYIPFPLPRFVAQLQKARTLLNPAKRPLEGFAFLDVGCGIGTKVAVAHSMDFDAYGIEIQRKYAQVARRLTDFNRMAFTTYKLTNSRQRKKRIHIGDALRHDYSRYDVIYFYCPNCDRKLQIKLERRIIKTAKVGAIILANMQQLPPETWVEKCKKVAYHNDIYIKVR